VLLSLSSVPLLFNILPRKTFAPNLREAAEAYPVSLFEDASLVCESRKTSRYPTFIHFRDTSANISLSLRLTFTSNLRCYGSPASCRTSPCLTLRRHLSHSRSPPRFQVRHICNAFAQILTASQTDLASNLGCYASLGTTSSGTANTPTLFTKSRKSLRYIDFIHFLTLSVQHPVRPPIFPFNHEPA
jgi:hypothetical protein